MPLSDRLRRARTERLIAAGALPSEFALKPEPDAAPAPPALAPAPAEDEPQGLFAPITIEVRPSGLHLVPEATRELTDMPEGEAIATCPNCNGVGRLDMVDLVGHTTHHTCENCGTMWQLRQTVNEIAAG